MSIKTFIQEEIFAPRLIKNQVLVIYDPERRYRELCHEMTLDKLTVIDTSDSSITSRSEAMDALLKIGNHEIEQMLVYVPTSKPIEEEDKQIDPFSLYAACGSVFPEGDGDQYLSICLKAKPDHATQVRAVFDQDPNPGFDVIDAIGGILNWPNLRALLHLESPRDILFALLTPSETQQTALKNSASWVTETKELLKASIGLELKTKGKTWSSIADELWRFLLFSEFTFDLPVSLPASLHDVPHADKSAQPLIEDICERLRNDRRTQNTYIQRAITVENELNLVKSCGHIQDLGQLDTFPFEERTFLRQTIDALLNNESDRAKQILADHAQSVWTGIGESQVQWDLLRSALSLKESCEDNERTLVDHAKNMDDLVDFYLTSLREVDQRHREFEQAVTDSVWQDSKGLMQPIQEQVRKQYGKLIEKVQFIFTKHIQQSGWPLSGRLSNAEVFDKYIAPKLEHSGYKVAFIMVDALRYELGLALEKQLTEDADVQITAALVQLPSTTLVGMASLLPGAAGGLRLEKKNGGFTPFINDQPVGTVAQRMDLIRKRYGKRFQEGRLEDFVRNRFSIEKDTDLLVLRSVEIDSHFENNPDTAPSEIINALKRVRVAIRTLKDSGFQEAIIATDHGFFMNTHAGAGDTCSKLSGDWINVHERSMLGVGETDSHHYSMIAEKVGIKGEYKNYAGPLSMASYRSGLLYYHGGSSLQECIVPVIQINFGETTKAESNEVTAVLRYKNGATRITTRLPVIDISIGTDSLFPKDEDFEILLEAHDSEGNVVGEAKPGGIVNPATGTLTLTPGEEIQVTIKMSMEFEGKFTIKALNPSTMAAYSQIKLQTDYTV
ncbi:MAG: PglZ domain-containing protein [Candidatus Marinimicrobia bacterium]|nr:PglZ domain-containing protein [Candidatus Neomarinimicrobiota bacterium]